MVEICDKQLAKDVVDGSEAAFRRLLDHHGPPISNFVRRMIRQQAEAEDIVQETFLRFWLNADRYQPQKSKLSTWLHRIAYHLYIDGHNDPHALAHALNMTYCDADTFFADTVLTPVLQAAGADAADDA